MPKKKAARKTVKKSSPRVSSRVSSGKYVNDVTYSPVVPWVLLIGVALVVVWFFLKMSAEKAEGEDQQETSNSLIMAPQSPIPLETAPDNMTMPSQDKY